MYLYTHTCEFVQKRRAKKGREFYTCTFKMHQNSLYFSYCLLGQTVTDEVGKFSLLSSFFTISQKTFDQKKKRVHYWTLFWGSFKKKNTFVNLFFFTVYQYISFQSCLFPSPFPTACCAGALSSFFSRVYFPLFCATTQIRGEKKMR